MRPGEGPFKAKFNPKRCIHYVDPTLRRNSGMTLRRKMGKYQARKSAETLLPNAPASKPLPLVGNTRHDVPVRLRKARTAPYVSGYLSVPQSNPR